MGGASRRAAAAELALDAGAEVVVMDYADVPLDGVQAVKLNLAERASIDAAVAELRARCVVFEEYDFPGLKTVDGIAEIEGNYPSNGVGERAVWFHDSEGNLFGIGQAMR